MTTTAIHRLVEERAARCADRAAIAGADRLISYGELNSRANVVARELMARGLRRGGRALVVLERGPELAVVLLAVLKAGGCYTWHEPQADTAFPRGVSIAVGAGGEEERYVTVDLAPLMTAPLRSCSNLPVITRGSDVAMVLEQDGDRLLVPHATVTTLARGRQALEALWPRHADALELWVALTSGATVLLAEDVAAAA